MLQVPGARDLPIHRAVARNFFSVVQWSQPSSRSRKHGPLTVTLRDNIYIFLPTDSFSRCADTFAVTATKFTAEGTTDILMNIHITLWDCSATLRSDNSLQAFSKFWKAVLRSLQVLQVATSSFDANGNGDTE